MIKLDKRLSAIKSELCGDSFADIGVDHGKLVVNALFDGTAKRAVAVDISEKSLEKARALAKYYGLDDKIIFLVGDGLLPLTDGVDTVVIAGLGGIAIAEILKKRTLPSKYVLVPHQDNAVLRKYLKENAFFIEKDYFVESGRKLYEIITAVKGESNYTEGEVLIGKNLPPTEAYGKYVEEREKKLKIICAGVAENTEKRVNEDILKELKEIERWKSANLRI